VKPARDFDAYQRALRERGLVSRLCEDAPVGGEHALDDLDRVADRVRALVQARLAAAQPDVA
jgi:hypothetical protein